MKGASPETDVVKWTFKDGTVLDVKQEEHSVRIGISARTLSKVGLKRLSLTAVLPPQKFSKNS